MLYIIIAVVVVIIVAVAAYVVINNHSTTPPTNNTLPAATLLGGGSSFAAPIMQTWTSDFYFANNQVQITYESLSSGKGQAALENNTFQFAGSDPPISVAQAQAYPNITQVIETCGGVTLSYNLPGIHSGLNLTAQVIAEIFQLNITKWNDPQIEALNPGLNLPDQTIAPIHRSDSSGTTNIFTNYLNDASNGTWVLGVGTSPSIFPTSEASGSGNGGVATLVNETTYSIGYIEFFYVASTGISYANIQNQAGEFVTPSLATIDAAVVAGAPLVQQNISTLIVNLPGSGVYPISSFTYVWLYKDLGYLSNGQATDLVNFLSWCVNKAQGDGPALYYPELPSSIVTLDNNILGNITYNGAAIKIYPANAP